ncbi:unnamed protein product, partial [Medioppia subpectinata]
MAELESNLETVCEHEPKVESRTVATRSHGDVRVHVQGSLDQMQSKAVFLTVHDIGANHSSWKDFVDNESMLEIKNRSVFVHLDVCGQEADAEDLEGDFPTIQQISHCEEVLADVLDALHVPLVVGLGEGAGANILARFALRHPERVLGLVLVHLVSAEVGFLDALKDRLFFRRNSQQMSPLDIVALHKIGKERDETSRRLMDAYGARVQTINARNLRKYVTAYMERKEIADLRELDVLLVTGAKSPYCAGVEAIHSKCNKTKTSLLKVDECTDVISEFPDKLAQSLLLFAKGLGFLTSCPSADGKSRPEDSGLHRSPAHSLDGGIRFNDNELVINNEEFVRRSKPEFNGSSV